MTQYSGKVIRKTPVTPTQTSASGVWKMNEAAAAVQSNTWPVAGVPDPISRSVRLRSSASAYLNRTPASASNQQKWTWSGWLKRGQLGVLKQLFTAGSGTTTFQMYFNGSGGGASSVDGIELFGNNAGTTVIYYTSTAVRRDPSAWYHIVLAIDTTQATAGNRVLLWVNNQISTDLTGVTVPAQNTNFAVNSTAAHYLGQFGSANYFDGYLTEINFIDGQALTPSSFGTTDAITGAWIPMAYTGTYGTNGFYLNFKDPTSTTTIGYDYSGNSNNWTANNISVTAGTTYDSMLDVPTNWIGYNTDGGVSVTRGNYCVLNAVAYGYYPTSRTPTSNGNLSFSDSSSSNTAITGTFTPTSGKWYFEMTCSSSSGVYSVGVYEPITKNESWYRVNGQYSSSFGGGGVSGYSSWTTGDVIGVAWDADAGKIWFAKNNTWQSGSPSAGTSPTNTFTANIGLTCAIDTDNSAGTKSGDFNFGQRPFTYTPPTGFKTLCTTNLSAPTIVNGASYMAATTYTGNGSTQSISNSGGFQPDFVWLKDRTSAFSHQLYDSIRGAGKILNSNLTNAESTSATNLTAFTSTGFTLGSDAGTNQNGDALVGWQWKAGGTAVSNTAGSITSSVSANTTAGFSVVTYTGTGANATVGHGLGVAPQMVIAKQRNAAGNNWQVYHVGLTSASYWIALDQTGAQTSNVLAWNNTAPTSTVFSVGAGGNANQASSTNVAYCFAPVAGYSAFGSYTGNSSADGPFLYTGFRPRWVMLKVSAGQTGDWLILDTSRDTYNTASHLLYADTSAAEDYPGGYIVDILSNGFKLRNSSFGFNNTSGTYIWAAFAESPFKFSNAR